MVERIQKAVYGKKPNPLIPIIVAVILLFIFAHLTFPEFDSVQFSDSISVGHSEWILLGDTGARYKIEDRYEFDPYTLEQIGDHLGKFLIIEGTEESDAVMLAPEKEYDESRKMLVETGRYHISFTSPFPRNPDEEQYVIEDVTCEELAKIEADLKSGNDLLFISSCDVDTKLYAGPGRDIISVGNGLNFIYGGTGNDEINGGSNKDRIDGEEGSDIIRSYAGDDIIIGRDGRDHLYGGTGDDKIYGGAEDDLIYGLGLEVESEETDNDRIYGGSGDDRIYGDLGNDLIYGQSGNDNINGNEGDDYICGGTGNDRLQGGDGSDKIGGQDGADTITPGETFDEDGTIGDLIEGHDPLEPIILGDRITGECPSDDITLSALGSPCVFDYFELRISLCNERPLPSPTQSPSPNPSP